MKVRQPGEGFGFDLRNSARALSRMIFPLRQRQNGGDVEFVVDPTNAIQVDPSKGAGIRTHSPLGVSPGSQPALTLDLGESMAIVNKKLEARPKIADVQGLDASLTVGRDALSATQTAVTSLQTDKENKSEKDTASGYAGLTASAMLQWSQVPSKTYVVTITGGAGQLVTSDFVDLTSRADAIVIITRITPGDSPGLTRTRSDTLDFASADDGDIEVAIFGLLA